MYAEPEDLITRFTAREISQVLNTPGATPDVAHPRLLAACEDAAGIVDGYLARVYPLPLARIPHVLVSKSADIARYRLHDDQIKEGGDTGKTTIRLRYEDAIRWLESVAKGEINLFPDDSKQTPLAPESPHPLRGTHRIAVVASPVVFDQKMLDRMDGARN